MIVRYGKMGLDLLQFYFANMSNTMDATCEAKSGYISGAPEITPVYCEVRVVSSSFFYVVSCVLLFVCLSLFFFHGFVSLFSI